MYKKINAIIYTLSILAIGFGGASFLAVKLDTGGKILTANVYTAEEINDKLEQINNTEKIILDQIEKPKIINKNNACPKPEKDYMDMSLLNLGQKIGLIDASYIPKNLMELSLNQSVKKGICLTKETLEAFKLMQESAKNDGHTIKVISGFRSYDLQKMLFDRKNVKNSSSVAKPGYSEHQLGTAVDLGGASVGYNSLSDSFGKTEEGKWLEENAYKFGFIMSYPKDSTEITGYIYEPWHYRYFGIPLANKIKNSGLTTTEFLK